MIKRFLAVSTFLLLVSNAFSCTIFTLTDGTKMLVGNNEDFSYSEDYFMRVTGPRKGLYGRLTFLTKASFIYEVVQGGMNDQGLFVDAASTPADPAFVYPLGQLFRRMATYLYLNDLLATCKTVDEAVVFLRETKFEKPAFHLLLADRRGQSVIVEWTGGAMRVVPSTQRCQVATNHTLTGSASSSSLDFVRDNLVERHAERSPAVTVANVASMLVEAMQNGETGGTLYSNVYDLENQSMSLFLRGKRSTMKAYRLRDLIAQGDSIRNVKDLFQ